MKKISGLNFFLQFIMFDKLPYICVHFWEKKVFIFNSTPPIQYFAVQKILLGLNHSMRKPKEDLLH